MNRLPGRVAALLLALLVEVGAGAGAAPPGASPGGAGAARTMPGLSGAQHRDAPEDALRGPERSGGRESQPVGPADVPVPESVGTPVAGRLPGPSLLSVLAPRSPPSAAPPPAGLFLPLPEPVWRT